MQRVDDRVDVGTYWQAADGVQSVDLNGGASGSPTNGAGAISQTLATVPGQPYVLSFKYSGNPEGPPVVKDFDVYWDGDLLTSFAFDVSGSSRAAMSYAEYSAVVTASAGLTELRFVDDTGSWYGAVVDTVSLNAYVRDECVVFEENFDSTALDPSRWSMFTNGYPLPAVAVSGGFVDVGQPGAVSADFPYVTNRVAVFPPTGDFRLDIVVQYTSGGVNGSGILLLDNTAQGVLGIWNDPQGLRVNLQDDAPGTPVGNPDQAHRYTLETLGTAASLFVDGAFVASASLTARPDRIWFGHPTVGQVASRNGWPSVDPVTGEVLARWWATTEWATFRLDSIRVTQ